MGDDQLIDAALQAAVSAREVHDRAGEARGLVALGLALQKAHRASEGHFICRQAERLGYEVGDRDIQGQAVVALGLSLEELDKLNSQDGSWRRVFLHEAGETEHFLAPAEARSGEFYTSGARKDGTNRASELAFVELAVGFVVLKFLGPFAEAFATKLGERLGESTASAISRIRLLWNHKNDRKDLDVVMPDQTTTTLVLPEDFTDAARLAAIDLDVNAEGVRGSELHWDAPAGRWRPAAITGPR